MDMTLAILEIQVHECYHIEVKCSLGQVELYLFDVKFNESRDWVDSSSILTRPAIDYLIGRRL